MSATVPTPLYLERPAFWTEPGDPEAWFRALQALSATTEAQPQTGAPRTVAERCLAGVIARRGAIGLFGVVEEPAGPVLYGVGLLERAENGSWRVTPEGGALTACWREQREAGLAALAGYLVRESPWLRLLLLRLRAGDWRLERWSHTRNGRAGLRPGYGLRLEHCAAPTEWFAGMEEAAAGPWLARARCARLALLPQVARRKKGNDDLSLAPLAAPLHLLETVGWLSPQGTLQLPPEENASLPGRASASETLTRLTDWNADLRGLVAVEPTLRELLAALGTEAADEAFPRWMDRLLERALATGALEILAAEPGQARHGRGLFGDPMRKLVRWVAHPEFDRCFDELKIQNAKLKMDGEENA